MKSKKWIIIFFLIALVGGGGYLYKTNPSLLGSLTGKKAIYFYIPEFEDAPNSDTNDSNTPKEFSPDAMSSSELKELATALTPEGYNLKIEQFIPPITDSIESIKSRAKNETVLALVTYTIYDLLNKSHTPLEILLSVSPDLKETCEIETSVLTPKKLKYNSLRDLNDKKVATAIGTTPLSIFIFPKLEQENVVFKQASLNIIFPWLMSQVEENNIQGIITNIFKIGDHRFAKFFGKIEGNEFKLFPQLALLESVNTKLPCLLLVSNKNTSQENKDAIKKYYLAKFNTKEARQTLKSKLRFLGHFYPYIENKESLNIMETYRQKRFRTFSKLVKESEI